MWEVTRQIYSDPQHRQNSRIWSSDSCSDKTIHPLLAFSEPTETERCGARVRVCWIHLTADILRRQFSCGPIRIQSLAPFQAVFLTLNGQHPPLPTHNKLSDVTVQRPAWYNRPILLRFARTALPVVAETSFGTKRTQGRDSEVCSKISSSLLLSLAHGVTSASARASRRDRRGGGGRGGRRGGCGG